MSYAVIASQFFPVWLANTDQPGVYYRPLPKLSSPGGTTLEPLSVFTYRLSTLTVTGEVTTTAPCYVRIFVEPYNNNPFSGGAGQALQARCARTTLDFNMSILARSRSCA